MFLENLHLESILGEDVGGGGEASMLETPAPAAITSSTQQAAAPRVQARQAYSKGFMRAGAPVPWARLGDAARFTSQGPSPGNALTAVSSFLPLGMCW